MTVEQQNKPEDVYTRFQARFGFDVRDPEQRERALEELFRRALDRLQEQQEQLDAILARLP